MPKGKRPRLDPDLVLEGRVRPDVRDLLSLIHDVNPSGREHLLAAEIARRYAVKARLQSLLVRRFGDEIAVEPVPGEPHLASLRHRASGVDACHAMIGALDDDARSWVQRALGLGKDEGEGVTLHLVEADLPPSSEGTDLVTAGREAIEAYDYDLARRHLDAAVEEGSAEGAALLLELLVEVLGDDGEALALSARLPPTARGRADVRSMLAMALARGGDRAGALGLVERLPADARTAAVLVVTARRAVEEGDVARAVQDLAEARRRDPASRELGAVEAAIERLRAPLEEKAQRALAEGRAEEAYALAGEILRRFPESKTAARVLRRRDEERRQESAGKIARDAEEAMVAGALGQARLLVLKARAEGIESKRAASLEASLGALENRARAKEASARVERTVAMLGGGNPAPGLLGYLGLPAALRAEVRARVPDARLGWLDETGVAEGSGGRAAGAVQGVIALARAEEDLAGDPRAALDRVLPHRKALAGVRRAEALVQVAERTLSDEARRRALAQIDAAEKAAEGAAGEEALRHAGRLGADVRARDLDERGRARLSALEGRVHRALARLARRAEADELRRKDEPLDALRVLQELLPDADLTERAELDETLATLRGEVRTAMDVRVEPLPPGTRLRLAGPDAKDPPRSILPGGEEVLLAQHAGGWTFLWVVAVASGEVRARVRMRVDMPIRIQRLVLEGGLLHLIGTTGSELVIEPRSFQPVDVSSSETSPDLDTDTTLAPGGRYTWVCAGSGGCYDVDVWDSKRAQWSRETRTNDREVCLRSLFGLDPTLAADPTVPAMAVLRPMFEESISLHAAHGMQLATHRKIWLVPRTLVVHPAGDTLLVVEMLRADATHPIRYRLTELDLKGVPLPMVDPDRRCLAFTESARPVQTVVDRGAGLVFLRLERKEGGHELIAVKTSPRGTPPPEKGMARPVEEIYRVPAPARAVLVEDPEGGPALLVARYEDGFTLSTLGAVPPVFRPDVPGAKALRPGSIRLGGLAGCLKPTGARGEAIANLGGTIFHEPDLVLRARVERARRAGPEALVDLIRALSYAQNVGLESEAEETLVEAFPDHPVARFHDAQLKIIDLRWDLVRGCLHGLDPAALDPSQARHFHHLDGLGLLMEGDREGALAALRRSEAHTGSCSLGLAFALALPLDDGTEAEHTWDTYELVVRALRRAVAAGDACLAAGDPEGAVRALDTLLVHDLREVQCLARLAEAYLSLPALAAPDPFVMAQALATFCGAHAETDAFTRCELPVSFPRWDAARLDALAARAEAWLKAPAAR